MTDPNYDQTFVIKMALTCEHEHELLRFLSVAIDNEDQSLSFDNLISLFPEHMMSSPDPFQYLLQWRLKYWGVAHDCHLVAKNVAKTEQLFKDNANQKYKEYLHFTSLFNLPIKLFKDISKYFPHIRYDMIFMKNDLSIGGRMIIENGHLINQTLIRYLDDHHDDFLFILQGLYDQHYPNQRADDLIKHYHRQS